MAFRADESIRDGCEHALEYLVYRNITGDDKERSQNILIDIIHQYGPVVSSYPSWHPLVSANKNKQLVIPCPSTRCGYEGLDHTVYFLNGFISCPYVNGQEIIDFVEKLPSNYFATITAERLDGKFYNGNTDPIFVKCVWNPSFSMMELDGTFPKSLAVPLMLENELQCWREANRAETWESMRSIILGGPHGKQSSLFVNQKTGQTLKKVWNTLIYTGMFGPIKV